MQAYEYTWRTFPRCLVTRYARATSSPLASQRDDPIMINGAHVVLYSKEAEADRAFVRDVLEFPHVDVGHGWLIFGLPPSELAVHPAERGGGHELFFMCEDVEALVTSMKGKGVTSAPIEELGWGRLTRITLPSGASMGIYEPRHERPPNDG